MLVLRCPNVTQTTTYYNLSRPLTSSERVDVTPHQSILIVGWSDPKPEDLAVQLMSTISIHLNLYYYSSPVRKNLSSKCDAFLPARSQFDSDHRVNCYTPTYCQSATFVRPLSAFVFCFLRQKSSKKPQMR